MTAKNKIILFAALGCALFFAALCAGCAGGGETAAPEPTMEPTPEPTPTLAERTLAEMTLEQKIGQLFIVRPEHLWTAQFTGPVSDWTGYSLTSLTDEMRQGLADFPVGGVALFEDNLYDPPSLTKLIGDLQQASGIPLFIAVDEEGGPVARLGNAGGFDVPQVGPMGDVGSTGESQNAYDAGLTIGTYLAGYGFNLDFAPVADVNTNPDNVVIGSRAFGSDPDLVAEMVPAALDGLHAAGIMGCVKHFPGHGDTSADTHDGYVSVQKDWEQMKQCELVPFIAALDKTDMVMAAHITAPNVTSDGLPASLSRQMIQQRLRQELGYEGVVITDAMEMGAVAAGYSSAEAAVLAIQAGVDILLMPANPLEAFDGVRAAVASGEISQARLDESVLRILSLKEQYGLLEP